MKGTIAKSLIELSDRNAYKDISVQVLCEITPISRPTFYKHFHSKEDVVKWFIRKDFMTNAFPFFQFHLKEKGVQTYFTYLKKNARFYKCIFEHDNGIFLNHCLQEAYFYGLNYKEDFSKKVAQKKGTINAEVFQRYAVAGIASVVVYWIENDMNIPEEQIANDLYLMIEEPLSYVRDYYLS